MDEKNAYIELVKQNRAKHRAKLKASKEIKKLEQKKEKVILKYEQAAKDNTCITFHQYCRKKWASEAGIESVPDDDETDVEWQEKLNAKQKEEDAWEDVPDVGNGLKRVNERLVARLRVILGTELVDHDLKLGAKTNITAQNAAFFDLLLLFEKKEGVQLFKNFMARALDEAAREDGWWLDSLDDSVMKAGDEVLKEIIIRGIRSLEMNRRLGLEKEKLELIIKLHFPKEVEDNKSCMIKTFEEGIEKNPDKAGNYLKLAVYAQEREALAINKQYNLGYATIDLGGAHILNKETAFVDDGKIKMISFPWSLFVHYSTKLTTWPRDVLMNGGKELAPSQELNFAREAAPIHPEMPALA